MQIKTTKAKKHYGQNFLTNTEVLTKIFQAAEITEQDQVLEIGPGTGNLTQLLAEACPNYLGLEVDLSLEKHLKDFNVSFMDALSLSRPTSSRLQINSQHPLLHNITDSQSLSHNLHSSDNIPERMILMVQKEVAEKICDQNILSSNFHPDSCRHRIPSLYQPKTSIQLPKSIRQSSNYTQEQSPTRNRSQKFLVFQNVLLKTTQKTQKQSQKLLVIKYKNRA